MLLASACAGMPPPSAGAGQLASDLILRASGKGNWEVACTATTARGTTVTAEMDGRGSDDFDVIVIRDAMDGMCSYAAGEAPLTLTLPDVSTQCPFEETAGDFCQTVMAAGSSGTFEFLAK